MKAERANHTLQPTALVHEVFLRMLGAENVEWQSRAHFFAVAARQMRHILVDHAWAVKAEKRGGGMKVSLEEAGSPAGKPGEDLLVVDEALSKLEDVDPRAAKVVELKFFSGLTDKETAEVLGIPVIPVRRDGDFAKAWMFHRLSAAPGV
jgi:RNA polymerase sigma-70 factor (ECF subfamily)